ncbi:hypothetical protein P9112_013721 [Eukaryota sp. TZLM1-RC]
MRICVTGCLHGCLHSLYQRIQGKDVDLVLCTGDFQGARDEQDLYSMACAPSKLKWGDFRQYYSGERTAPILTIVVGGNHEASRYLAELKDGGWLCHNIYFMGFSGVVKFGSLTIGGVSGTFKNYDYHKGYCERFPLNESDKRSIYHIRQFEIAKILAYSKPLDIFISHDWPQDITEHGDTTMLLKAKPYLRRDIKEHKLGCPGLKQVIQSKAPSFAFASHHHFKWSCRVDSRVDFLALSHLERYPDNSIEIMDIEGSVDGGLQYDTEWLALLIKSDTMFPHFRESVTFNQSDFTINQVLIDSISTKLESLSIEPYGHSSNIRQLLGLEEDPWSQHYWGGEDLINELVEIE